MAQYLLAVSPIRGHVMPMVTIGTGLRELGHDVTVLTGAEFAGLVRDAELDVRVLPADVDVAPPSAPPALVRRLHPQVRRFWSGRAELRSVFVDPLVGEAQSLRQALAAGSFDAVLVDVAFTGALPVLLQDAPRPPVVVCGVGPLTLSSAHVPPFGMAWQPEAGVDYRPMTAIAHRVIMRSSQRGLDAALRRAGSPSAPVFVSDWPRLADAVVQLSVEGFEYPRADLPSSVEFVGPLVPGRDARFVAPAWWPDVLEARTVVHVTQGTFDNADLDQLIAPTLAALDGREDTLVVATTGRPGTAPSGSLPDNARVADWLPYSALLPHVDVMITNGGFGGVQSALGYGIPVIVAGETSDKAEVAARVAYAGVGIDIGTATPSADAVRSAVERVLRDDAYRTAAAGMRQAIDASTPVDSIANVLKRCRG